MQEAVTLWIFFLQILSGAFKDFYLSSRTYERHKNESKAKNLLFIVVQSHFTLDIPGLIIHILHRNLVCLQHQRIILLRLRGRYRRMDPTHSF